MSRNGFRLVTGRALKQFVWRLGFEISRIPRIESAVLEEHTQDRAATPWIIEFTGPSGVGKSHFLNFLQQTWELSDPFLLDGDPILRTNFKNQSRVSAQSYLLRWIHSRHLTNSAIWGIAQLGSRAKFVRWPLEKIERELSWMTNAELRNNLGSNVLVTDHHLLQFDFEFLQHLEKRRQPEFQLLTHHRAAVVCTVDVETGVERLLRRRSYDFGVRGSDFISARDLSTHLSSANLRWMDRADWLESVGVPVLRLDLGRPLEESKKHLKEFVRSLQ